MIRCPFCCIPTVAPLAESRDSDVRSQPASASHPVRTPCPPANDLLGDIVGDNPSHDHGTSDDLGSLPGALHRPQRMQVCSDFGECSPSRVMFRQAPPGSPRAVLPWHGNPSPFHIFTPSPFSSGLRASRVCELMQRNSENSIFHWKSLGTVKKL